MTALTNEKEEQSKADGASERKHRAICQAAVDLFLSEGYDGASMDRIASDAGVSKRTVYNRFKSKDDLFAAVIKDVCVRVLPVDMPEDAMDEAPDPFLRRFAEAFLTVLMTPELIALHRLLSFEAARNPVLRKSFMENGPERVIRTLREYLDRQVHLGRLRIADLPTAAWQLAALIKEPLHLRATFGDTPQDLPAAIRAQAKSAVSAFLEIYAQKPA